MKKISLLVLAFTFLVGCKESNSQLKIEKVRSEQNVPESNIEKVDTGIKKNESQAEKQTLLSFITDKVLVKEIGLKLQNSDKPITIMVAYKSSDGYLIHGSDQEKNFYELKLDSDYNIITNKQIDGITYIKNFNRKIKSK